MIDVYEGNGKINWGKVHAAGVRHAYLKVTEGTVHEDGRVHKNVEGARHAGIVPGLYHFAGSSVNRTLYAPHREAAYCLRNAHGLYRSGDLPLALDLENSYGHSWEYLNDWKAQWFAAVDHELGTLAVFYSYYYFWKRMILRPGRPVWGAGYGSAFAPPPSWTIQQYSSTGHVDGVWGDVDLSRRLQGHDWPVIP